MTIKKSISLVFAFSQSNSGGNPCFVRGTSGSRLDMSEECILEAKKQRCEVSHIHFGDDTSQAHIRFYSPAGEKSFCGHGSLAAAAWAAKEGLTGESLILHSEAGTLSLFIEKGGRSAGFVEEAGHLREFFVSEMLLKTLRTMLGHSVLQRNDIRLWTGGRQRTKAIIKVEDRELLESIKLDAGTRDRFCEALAVTGIYVYFEAEQGRILARHFPLNSGESEDMATGNIAATMGRHISGQTGQPLLIGQGGPRCDVSRLHVQPRGTQWLVGGECRFVDTDSV